MKPVKDSVAFVIYGSNRSQILVVQRPFDDDNLPGVWGLPAGSLKKDESYEQTVLRAGREKLGVELNIEKKIGEGNDERDDYLLHMIEYEASIAEGVPSVPQNVEEVTQYRAWMWSHPLILREAARKGSLCSKIYLLSRNIKW